MPVDQLAQGFLDPSSCLTHHPHWSADIDPTRFDGGVRLVEDDPAGVLLLAVALLPAMAFVGEMACQSPDVLGEDPCVGVLVGSEWDREHSSSHRLGSVASTDSCSHQDSWTATQGLAIPF